MEPGARLSTSTASISLIIANAPPAENAARTTANRTDRSREARSCAGHDLQQRTAREWGDLPSIFDDQVHQAEALLDGYGRTTYAA